MWIGRLQAEDDGEGQVQEPGPEPEEDQARLRRRRRQAAQGGQEVSSNVVLKLIFLG